MEAKFYKDYKHNYMVLRCEQAAFLDTYSYKMLSMAKITNLLNCSARYMNNEAYLYYDIGSRISLYQMYQNRKLGYVQIKELFSDIEEMLAQLHKFFMEESALLLQPEYLYYDFTLHKYRGVYYPEEEAEENYYEPLLNFILEHVDTEQQALTDAVYQFYEMGMQGSFSLEGALQLLEEACDMTQENCVAASWSEETGEKTEDEKEMEIEEVRKQQAIFLSEDSPVERMEEKAISGKGGKLALLFTVLSLLGMVAAVAVWYFYALSQEEEMVLFGCMAVMGGCFLIGLLQCLRKATHRKKEGERNWTGELESTSLEVGYEEIPSLEKVLDRDMNMAVARCGYQEKQRVETNETMCRKERQAEYGGTVFFEESVINGHKLYAMDKKNKKHIGFDNLPCTIGSLPGYVDVVLSGNSVSRVHARLEREGDKVLLTDLNSTNGTFKNGLRMEPQETVEIEPGDEIRFGQICYCYR